MNISPSRFAVTATAFAVLTIAATGLANAQPPQCSNSIIACGCTIGAPGDYQVENELYASQGLTLKDGCIDIEGQNVNLYVNFDIIGAGSNSNCGSDKPHLNFGVGIHVLPTATNISIYDSDYICGWNYGVESETNNVNFYAAYTYYDNVGMFLNNATNNNCLYCYFYYNVTGFQISGGSGNSFNDGYAHYNSQYGYWVDGSEGNTLSHHQGDYNGKAGFYLGCSSTGQANSTIPCNKNTPTTGNSLIDNYAYDNYRYGIAVERKSIYNNFNGNYTSYGNTAKDIIDGNGNCIYNNYLDDSYSTKSPNCIR